MYEQILLWVGLGVLLFLCLPIPPVQKLILTVSAWALRLGMIALLAAGAYLWFNPEAMPASVSAVFADFPGLMAILPASGSSSFGLSVACLIVAALVPLLAALDIVRQLGQTASTSRELASEKSRSKRVHEDAGRIQSVSHVEHVERVEVVPEAQEIEEPVPVGVPLLRPIERRDAAGAIASAGSRRLNRPAE
jgi:hypothetical protein